jgi:hypothetical protein
VDVAEGTQRLNSAFRAFQNLLQSDSDASGAEEITLPYAMLKFRSVMQACTSMYRRIWPMMRACRRPLNNIPIHTVNFYVNVKFILSNVTNATDTTDTISFEGNIQNPGDQRTGDTALVATLQCIHKKMDSRVTLWQQAYHGADLTL